VSDILIQDNALKGSPILSYGQSGHKHVWSGLFSIVLIVLGVLIVLIGVLFWFFTKIPVPENATLIAILPSGTQLPSSAPDTWLEAVNQNKIFPTVVGFTAESGKAPEPFAVKTPSLFDLSFLKTGHWSLRLPTSNFQLLTSRPLVYKSPASLFGLPFVQKKVSLTINLKNLLSGPGAEFKDLPEVLSGFVDSSVWQTKMAADDQFSLLREDSGTGGFAPIKPQTSLFVKNAFISQGIVLDLPSDGILSWNSDGTSSEYEFTGATELSKDAKIALLEAKNVFDSANYNLPDNTMFKALRPPTDAVASNTHLFVNNSFKFDFTGQQSQLAARSWQLDGAKCTGKVLAVFDQPAIKNMCSWLGFCFMQPQRLVVTEQSSQINFCYTGL
jgi:hypothetical protein